MSSVRRSFWRGRGSRARSYRCHVVPHALPQLLSGALAAIDAAIVDLNLVAVIDADVTLAVDAAILPDTLQG